jgi:hypothetical protein
VAAPEPEPEPLASAAERGGIAGGRRGVQGRRRGDERRGLLANVVLVSKRKRPLSWPSRVSGALVKQFVLVASSVNDQSALRWFVLVKFLRNGLTVLALAKNAAL